MAGGGAGWPRAAREQLTKAQEAAGDPLVPPLETAEETAGRLREQASEPEKRGPKGAEEANSGIQCPKSDARRSKQLRAINRAPASVRSLYDNDLLAVDVAAKFGPDLSGLEKKDPAAAKAKREEIDRRANALQSRLEAIQVFQPNMPPRQVKREMNAAAREVLGLKEQSPLDQLRAAWKKASREEREAFVTEIGGSGW